MAFFTDNFLNNRRAELLRAVTRFQYQLNKSTWVDGEINSKEIAGTAVVVYVKHRVPVQRTRSPVCASTTTTVCWPGARA